ncbi:MAG: hypothetical protein AAF806_01900 [Bacteroidota bacterium]
MKLQIILITLIMFLLSFKNIKAQNTFTFDFHTGISSSFLDAGILNPFEGLHLSLGASHHWNRVGIDAIFGMNRNHLGEAHSYTFQAFLCLPDFEAIRYPEFKNWQTFYFGLGPSFVFRPKRLEVLLSPKLAYRISNSAVDASFWGGEEGELLELAGLSSFAFGGDVKMRYFLKERLGWSLKLESFYRGVYHYGCGQNYNLVLNGAIGFFVEL